MITPAEENLFSDATWTTEIGTGAADVVQPFGSRRLIGMPPSRTNSPPNGPWNSESLPAQ